MDVVKMLSKEKGIKLFQIARKVKSCPRAGKEGNCKTCPGDSCGKEEQGEKKTKKAFKMTVTSVCFTDEVNAKGKKGRTECVSRILNRWRVEGKSTCSPQCLFHSNSQPSSVWMDEMFPIYAPPKSFIFDTPESAACEPFGNIAFDVERAGVPLFGCQAFGVHLTEKAKVKTWKSPLKYDSSVAGGLPAGHTPTQGLIKESEEEAGWPERFIKEYTSSYPDNDLQRLSAMASLSLLQPL
ncbi:hypothetical protein I309_00883 [Cryptococcus deuterogattii LA55]|nr:hypothetical protein I309_00883 [Cryptococcus deuterogattii LA55]KIR92866.1 hypothetical protein I304_03447 [Cryptococcus deuterogattii CBS 10090]